MSARLRDDAVAIFQAAVRAVDPAELVAQHVRRVGTFRGRAEPILLVGAGKAAAKMAAGCEQVLGADRVHGEVVVAAGCAADLQSIRVSEAGHPLPDARGEAAARRIIEHLRSHNAGGILCVVSGGASSLLVCPRPPVTLADKIHVNRLLIDCGARIDEINTVRKHLSEVKGGGLLRYAQQPVMTLLISDVVGDDPGTIGSAPTVADPTTFADALAVLQRYDLTAQVSTAVMQLLERGRAGHVPETVKPGSIESARAHHQIVGSNRTAIEAAAVAARRRGWQVIVEAEPLVGDTTAAAQRFAARLRDVVAQATGDTPICVLAGGETTVRVSGSGRGGRNQEFALALAAQIAGTDLLVLSAGTDGTDGPTDAAGAFVDGATLANARARGLDAAAALAANDSYTFFSQLGDLFRCGPTGTNVMDIKIALAAPADVVPSRQLC